MRFDNCEYVGCEILSLNEYKFTITIVEIKVFKLFDGLDSLYRD